MSSDEYYSTKNLVENQAIQVLTALILSFFHIHSHMLWIFDNTYVCFVSVYEGYFIEDYNKSKAWPLIGLESTVEHRT